MFLCMQYLLSYGGGLLGGDKVEISCEVGAGCTAALTTQVNADGKIPYCTS